MGKNLHQGEFIKKVLDDHDKILARIARKASMSPQNLSGLFKRARVDEDIIERLSIAAKLDLRTLLSTEKERLGIKSKVPVVADPPSPYGQGDNRPVHVFVISPGDADAAKRIAELLTKVGK